MFNIEVCGQPRDIFDIGPAQKAGLQQPLASLDVEGRLDQPRLGRGHRDRGAGHGRRHSLTAPSGEHQL